MIKLNKLRLYYIGFFFLALKFFVDSSYLFSFVPDMVGNLIGFISLFFFIISFFTNLKIELVNIFKLVLIFALVLVSTFLVKEYILIISLISAITIPKNQNDKVFKNIYLINLVMFLFVVFGSLALLVVNRTGLVYSDSHLVFKYGFGHQNEFSGYLIWLVLLRIYNKKRITLTEGILYLIIAAFAYITTRSDIIILCTVVATILFIFVKYWRGTFKAYRFLASISFALIGLFVLVAMKSIYSRDGFSNFFLSIDSYLSGRMRIGARILADNHSISLIGQYIKRGIVDWDSYYGLNSVTVDGLYICLFLQYGVIWFIIFSLLFYKTCKSSSNFEIVFLILYAVYGLAEVHCMNTGFAFPLLLILNTLMSSKQYVFKKRLSYARA